MCAETRLVAFVCAAEILGLAGFSLVPALLPQFIATWSLSNVEAGWLAGMMSGGYMVGVLPLVALADHTPAPTIFLVCSALSALSSFGIALSDGLLPGRRDQAAPFGTVCCRRSVSRPRRARLAAAAGPCSAAPSDRLPGYQCVSCRAYAAPMLRNRRAHGLIIAHRLGRQPDHVGRRRFARPSQTCQIEKLHSG